MPYAYALEPHLPVEAFIDVLRRSTLAERRPVTNLELMARMVAQADVIATARTEDGALVGVSRALTDFAFCTYLSDLAVDVAFQRQGIGRQLMTVTHAAAGLHTTLILLAAPKARGYYPHVGLQPHDSCWTIPAQPISPPGRT